VCYSPVYSHNGVESIVALLETGQLSEEIVNQRVAEMLSVKDDLGLFENPYWNPEYVLVAVWQDVAVL